MNYREVLKLFNENQYQGTEHWYDLVDPAKENPDFFKLYPEIEGKIYCMKLGVNNIVIFTDSYMEICSPVQPDNVPEVDMTVFYHDISGIKFLHVSGEIDIYVGYSIIRLSQTISQKNYWRMNKTSMIFRQKAGD